MQAAEFTDQFVAGAQVEMVGVGEDDLCAEFFERFVGERFNGCLCAYRHEKRRLDGAVRSGQAAAAGAGWIGLRYFKGEAHPSSVSGENERPAHAKNHEGGPNAKGDGKRFRTFQLLGIHGGKSDSQQN